MLREDGHTLADVCPRCDEINSAHDTEAPLAHMVMMRKCSDISLQQELDSLPVVLREIAEFCGRKKFDQNVVACACIALSARICAGTATFTEEAFLEAARGAYGDGREFHQELKRRRDEGEQHERS